MGLVSFVMKMLAKSGKKVIAELDEATKNPRESQQKILERIIQAGKDTVYGKEYNFDEIKSIEDFQKKVPVTVYDNYAPYIERMANGEKGILTNFDITHFNKTSGTIGLPKKIPLSEEQIKLFGGFNAKYMNALAAKYFGTEWCKGKGLSLNEGKYEVLPSGLTYGSASSVASSRMNIGPFKDMMGMMYTSPIEARQPDPKTNTRYLHALFALAEKNITYANATFTSYIYEIMRFIENNWEVLVDNIEKGEISEDFSIEDSARISLNKKFKANPKRAKELREIFSAGFNTPFAPKVWPKLRYTLCVGGGSFYTYYEKLRDKYFGSGIDFIFMGVTASEGFFSIPVEANSIDGVLVPNGDFLEFLPIDDDDFGNMKTMDQLEVGKRYEIIVTNLCGFYRYRMRDAVEVVGFYNSTPLVRFLYRIDQTVSITGEKTTEIAIKDAVEKATKELGVEFVDYSLYPDVDSTPLRYVFILELDKKCKDVDKEALRAALDKYISITNPSMGDKIARGICAPSGLIFLQPETYLLYRDVKIAKGAAGAQLKPVHIIRNEFQRRFFFGLEDK